MQMNRVGLPRIGDFVWCESEYKESDFVWIKLIRVDQLYWDDTPDLQGWNVICGNEEYYLETCLGLELPFNWN